MYRQLQGGPGIPKVRNFFLLSIYFPAVYMYISSILYSILQLRWYGTEGEYNILVMDLLGSSLEDMFEKYHHRFSLKTILLLAE